jgi:aminoglycoside phosphotransferase (APT) family kinase protein
MEEIELEKQLIRSLANLSGTAEIVEHTGGWDSRVYSFEHENYFFKFPRTEKVRDTYALEIAALKLAAGLETEVKIPKVMWQHPENAYFGYEGMPGVSLNTVCTKLGAGAKQSIGAAMGEFLRQFHQCELKDALVMGIAEEVAQLHAWYADALSPIRELLDANDQARIEDLVARQIPARIAELGSSMQLCHGDLAGWNIIYLEDGQVGIIDFGKPCYCDSSRDLLYFGDEVITEYAVRAYGDTPLLRSKVAARILIPEINSLLYYSGKGMQAGVQETIGRIKRLL